MTISTLTNSTSPFAWRPDVSPQRQASAMLKPAPQAPQINSAIHDDFRHRPLPPKQQVNKEAAGKAFDRILQKIGVPLRFQDLEKVSTSEILAKATLGLFNNQLKLAQIEVDGQTQRTKVINELRLKQCDDLRNQINKGLEDQQKAKKAGIFNAIFSWISAAFKIVVGILKCVAGNVLGGVADLFAGAAGIVKAIAATLAVADPDNAEKYNKVAEYAGYVEMAFDVLGMGLDLGKAVKGLIATKGIAKATSGVVAQGAGQQLANAIQQGSKTSIQTLANEIAQQTTNLLSETLKTSLAKVSQEVAQRFTREGVEKIVEKAVLEVAKQAMKKSAQVTTERLVKAVEQQVRMQVLKTIMKATITSTANTVKFAANAAVQASSKITTSAIALERAELQKNIQELAADMAFSEALIRQFQSTITQHQEAAKSSARDANQTYQIGMQGLNNIAYTQRMITNAL